MPEVRIKAEYIGDKSTSRGIANKIKNYMESLGISGISIYNSTITSDSIKVDIRKTDEGHGVIITSTDEDLAEQVASFANLEREDTAMRGRVGSGSQQSDTSGEVEFQKQGETTGNVSESESDGTFGPVFKPFDHEEARYFDRGHENFDTSHPRCEDCAHYDGEGNCHIVPNIEPSGYCERFFADAGFFVDGGETVPDPAGVGRKARLSLAIWGERIKALEKGSAAAVVEEIKDALVEKVGVVRKQFIGE